MGCTDSCAASVPIKSPVSAARAPPVSDEIRLRTCGNKIDIKISKKSYIFFISNPKSMKKSADSMNNRWDKVEFENLSVLGKIIEKGGEGSWIVFGPCKPRIIIWREKNKTKKKRCKLTKTKTKTKTKKKKTITEAWKRHFNRTKKQNIAQQ
jgi:hypothetical protein